MTPDLKIGRKVEGAARGGKNFRQRNVHKVHSVHPVHPNQTNRCDDFQGLSGTFLPAPKNCKFFALFASFAVKWLSFKFLCISQTLSP
jgi:hypothetical protein